MTELPAERSPVPAAPASGANAVARRADGLADSTGCAGTRRAQPLGGRLYARLNAPIDSAWLAALRVFYGLALCASMLRFLGYGWVDEFFVKPRFHFKYWGFRWLEPLPSPLLHGLFWLLAALALMVAAGLCFRWSCSSLVAGFSYLQLIDVATYLNHYYLASLLGLLLALSPAGRVFSLDARLWPKLRVGEVKAGVQLGFRFQVAVVYTFAGLAKAHADWLLHAQPLRIWLGSHTGMPGFGWLFSQEWTAIAMSWGGFFFDTTIVWWLLWHRTRPYAYALLVAFHVAVGELFPIGMFPAIMIFAALVFFPPDWPRGALAHTARVLRAPWARAGCPPEGAMAGMREGRARSATAALRPFGSGALALAGVYCALQLFLPLRWLAYGGDVRWHEQGMRFSWRVMVREKNGSVTYLVRSKQSGRTWHVEPRRYLTPIQEREMAGQPDLILQLAHHIEREFARRGMGEVEIRAEALVSLNGRPAALLIDPRVDLATVRDGLAPAAWIMPAPVGAPPHLRPI